MTDLYNKHYHISSKHNLLDFNLKEVWEYKELIWLFTKRSFLVSYKQTVLGPLWLIINPLLTSFIYVVVFGNIAKLGTDNIPQILFYLSGTAIWSYFSACFSNNSSLFLSNARLFSKVYFPRIVVSISNILGAIIRFLIQMIPVVILIIYYLIKGMINPHFALFFIIPLILIWLACIATGLGLLVSGATTKYRDLSVLASFGLQLLMYATPVVYPLSSVPSFIKTLSLLNPLTMPIEIYRYILLGNGTIYLWSIVVSLLITTIVFFAGLIVFNKVEKTFIDTI